MNKQKLLTFIDKANIGEVIEAVKIVSDGTDLYTECTNPESSLWASVKLKNAGMDKYDLYVYSLSILKNFLKVLGEDITISPHKGEADKLLGLFLNDGVTEVNYVLADESVVPKPKSAKKLPDPDVEILLDEGFMSRYIKAKAILSDKKAFTLLMDKKTNKLEFVIGYEMNNSNRIKLDITPVPGKDKVEVPISFDANHLREILASNRDCTSAVLSVYTKGLAVVTFSVGDYESVYRLSRKVDE
jgi:hypothetical protein